MRKKWISFLYVVLAAPFWNIQAAEHQKLPVINVTASHLLDTPLSVKNTVITVTSKEIEQYKPRNLVEILKTLPGIDASQSGGSGGRSYVSIRGGDPNFTLFLLNGVKINNPTDTAGGGVDLAFINPAIIARIDIYPGGVSSIHGAGSLGGIISITTKDQGMDPGYSASIEKGSDNSREINFSAVSQIGDTPHILGISSSYLNGGDIVLGDEHKNRNITGTMELELNENSYLSGHLSASDGNAAGYPEDSGGFRLASIRDTERREIDKQSGSLGLVTELPSSWTISTQASIYDSREQLDNPGIAAGVLAAVPAHTSDNKYQRNEFSITFNRTLGATDLSFGGDYAKEWGESRETIDLGFPFTGHYKLSRESSGIFGEVSMNLTDNFSLDASARHEKPSSHKEINLFRLASAYRLVKFDSTIQISWSEGYKLPSLFALGSALVGNPNLKPETSDTYEIRLLNHQPTWDTRFNFALFHSVYRDLIDFDSTSFTMVNRDRVRVDGAEIAIKSSPVPKLLLSAGLTYSDAKIIGEMTKLRRRPLWKGNLSTLWNSGSNWDFRLGANYNGEFYDSSVPTGMIKMPSFWSINTAVNWTLSNNVALNFKVDNIFDDKHEESIGFPSPGRQAFLTFTALY